MLLPWLQRRRQQRRQTPGGGGHSAVQSLCLTMRLDHDSQRITGEVIDGPFSGRELDDLDEAELTQLARHCQQHDPDGLALLQSYARHRLGEELATGPAGETGGPSEAPLSRAEALDRKSTRLNSSHVASSYAVFCLKKNNMKQKKHQ